MASELTTSTTRPQPVAIQTSIPVATSSKVPGSPISATSSTFPQVVPDVASQTGRNLILCFDGTGDQYDQDNSNIVRFVQLLKKDDKSKQMATGIGTGVGLKPTNKFVSKVSQAVDMALATGLSIHVRAGYEFLMQNYSEGDRISLFGFSRGAYTARALAGMLHKVGLLPAYNHEQVPFAYKMFKRDDPEGWKMSNGFKRAFCTDVKIDFVGVFDTVNSVGIIPRELPFAKTNYLIRVFRHAVALDERRAKFKANMWGRATEEEEMLGAAGKRGIYIRKKTLSGVNISSFVKGWEEFVDRVKVDHGKDKDGKAKEKQAGKQEKTTDVVEERADHDVEKDEDEKSGHHESIPDVSHHGGQDCSTPEEREHETDVKEVWFAGAHCDVGGGSVLNETKNHLARIPLRWMVRECFLNNTGILFHSTELAEIGLSPCSLWPIVKIPTPLPPLPTSELKHELDPTDGTLVDSPPSTPLPGNPLLPLAHLTLGSNEDANDAITPIYDQLTIAKWWWILEVMPLRQRYQRHDKTWRTWFEINMGRSRKIHGQKRFPTYVHRSVLYRMQELGYVPRAELLANPSPIWVD
ncbi:choline transport protein [Rhizoctonia solani]|uniref:Choline transport protein n=1 Tax=Rhizoctonia solani TaxID=456999 RepID=A0A8H8P6X0_9AGAM|nr:choline transport protein [Rhizoctonia solani]QRW26716.1 choline transport protein [Rhizoctonia solani]